VIARDHCDHCDHCHGPFTDGEQVFTFTMTGSAPALDGVNGEKIYLHASCANTVTDVIKHGKQDERMILSHNLALTIKGREDES
jgi:hypothetical protein